jgi:hypothetical protein
MVLKLHGSYSSGRTRLVLLVLKEKNIPYEFIPVNLPKGEQKLPEHLKYNPFGVVPVIVRYLLRSTHAFHSTLINVAVCCDPFRTMMVSSFMSVGPFAVILPPNMLHMVPRD